MARTKDKVLTIRTTSEIRELLRLAAAREHRSAASMIEVLVLDYARMHGLAVAEPDQAGRTSAAQDETIEKNQ